MKLLIRLSPAAWHLLLRLHEEHADLSLCNDPSCYRFHMVTKGRTGEIVRNLTMEALIANGFLKRSRDSIPTYNVSPKAVRALRRKGFLNPYGELEDAGVRGPSFAESALQEAPMS